MLTVLTLCSFCTLSELIISQIQRVILCIISIWIHKSLDNVHTSFTLSYATLIHSFISLLPFIYCHVTECWNVKVRVRVVLTLLSVTMKRGIRPVSSYSLYSYTKTLIMRDMLWGVNEVWIDISSFCSTQAISGECILGMNVTYVRRKQDTICKVPENFTIPQIINICSCTEADWVW